MSKFVKWLNDSEAEILGFEPKEVKRDGRRQARYYITEDQWHYILNLRNKGVADACNDLGVGTTNTPYMWLKSKEASAFVRNPNYETPEEADYKKLEDAIVSKIEKVIKKGLKAVKRPKIKYDNSEFDFVCLTDVHIGMQPNPNGFSLYGGKWDRDEVMDRISLLLNHAESTKRSDSIVVFDLGDFLDGWDSKTTRKQHDLPQNMTNEEAFDCGFDAKVYLASELSKMYANVEFVNIVDDNHSGSFAYVVNKSVKSYVEAVMPNVTYKIQRKFIDYHVYGNKCFISTHGKDGTNLRFGFKPFLDSKQIEVIENYISEYDLHKYEIFFIKGDSHQDIFDNTTSQKFKYWNFPAFSPSSNWVQTNFKKGISGFYSINFRNETYRLNPYYFKWKS